MPTPMQSGRTGPTQPAQATPDPYRQPALANAVMLGKTFTQLAPPGSRPGPGAGPKYPAKRGVGFQKRGQGAM